MLLLDVEMIEEKQQADLKNPQGGIYSRFQGNDVQGKCLKSCSAGVLPVGLYLITTESAV
jgi:hypothetical protein